MSAPKNMAKRTAAGTLALAVCLSGGALALAGAAQADSTVTFGAPIKGNTRLDTAVAMSKLAYPTSASSVVLVNEYATVDGLTASYLAGLHGAPILYTDVNTTPQQTSDEIKRLGAKNVFFVGGNLRISDDQMSYWKSQGMATTRVGGADRYGTAKAIAEDPAGKPTAAFVATGAKQADALALGPVAYSTHMPILLADPGHVDQTQMAMKDLGITKSIPVGGTVALNPGVSAAVNGDESKRLAGTDRGDTAAKIAGWAIANAGFTTKTVGLVPAADQGAVDALSSASVAGMKKEPLLFAGLATTNNYLSQPLVSAALTGQSDVFGNIPDDAVKSAAIAANTPSAAAQAFTVTASGSTSPTVSVSGDNAGMVQYTASGLGSGKVDIALVPSSDVIVDPSGTAWLRVSSTSSTIASLNANLTTGAGALAVVNGVGASGQKKTGITPSNGTVTFTVNATVPDSVVPVVYTQNDSDTLTVNNGSIKTMVGDDSASHYYATVKGSFGLGAKTKWNPAAAVTGAYGTSGTASTYYTIDSVDTTAKTISAHNNTTYWTFTYGAAGSTYVYGIGGGQLSLDQFAATLSKGDIFFATYNANGPSTFTISTDSPAAPSDLKAAYSETANGGSGAVKMTWTKSVSLVTSGYTVTRYAVTNGVASTSGTTVDPSTQTSSTSGGVTTYTLYDTSATAGTYVYAIQSTSGTSYNGGTFVAPVPNLGAQSPLTPPVVVPTSTVAGAVAGAPYITSTTLSDTNSNFLADAGDLFQILFDEPTSGAASTGTAYRINDGTSAATITLGTNATGTYAPAGTYTINGKSTTVKDGQLVLIRITDLPSNFTTSSSSAPTKVSYPASITQITSNVQDLDESNAVNLSKGSTSLSTAVSGTLASSQSTWTETAPTTIAAPTVVTGTAAKSIDVTATAATGQGSGSVLYTYRVYSTSGDLKDTWAGTSLTHTFVESASTAYTVTVTAANASGYITSQNSASATSHS